MKMPNSRQLSEEQLDIFEDAPIDDAILVTGPPGTGKTVIAFLRAQTLAKKNQDVIVLMFNRVLRRYTENVASQIEGSVQSKTMHSWLPEWWRSHKITQDEGLKTFFIDGNRVYVNCPREEKEELKKLRGYGWDKNRINPFTNKRGMWFVWLNRYNSDPDKFSKWTGASYEPPELERWCYDWLTMRDQYLDLEDEQLNDWGHLIIDEAQDFEPEMYAFLRMASKQLDNGGLTILADENQRLEESRHSSLQDIRSALKIQKDREFKLTKNFRNTEQIAKVASHFYVGLESGVPDLPDRQGSKPVLVSTINSAQQVKFISNFLRFKGALEVGVIVDSEDDRAYFYDALSESLSSYTVQTYTSSNYMDSESMTFDTQGVVTVLHRKSCKGLEFDVVFVPQLQRFAVEDVDITTFKMNMYVICSRARSDLFFFE